MLDLQKQMDLAQMATVETFQANALVVAQPADWHSTAERLTSVASNRLGCICRNVGNVTVADMTPTVVTVEQYALKAQFHLNGAVRDFRSDMYGMALPNLIVAEETLGKLLATLRGEA